MAAITEDYISFETAKLLKKKGFSLPSTNFEDWLCCMYDENGNIQWGCYHSDYYARVTLQMAMKWLRELYNIKVNVFYNNSNYAIEYFEPNTQTGVGKFVFIGDGYDVYEEACEAAIKYCLEKLI